jgi:hypothetical protein
MAMLNNQRLHLIHLWTTPSGELLKSGHDQPRWSRGWQLNVEHMVEHQGWTTAKDGKWLEMHHKIR